MQPANSPWSRLLDSLAGAAPRLATFIIMVFAALALATSAAAQASLEASITQIPIDGKDLVAHQTALSSDGRWLAGVAMEGPNNWSLWIAPAAGGERVRLTSAGYLDREPTWSPTGDRLFFVSNRPARGEPGSFIMTLRIDPETGRALDEPRRVTLEQSSYPVASPDGRSILYRAGLELRVVPAMGGTPRVVATMSETAPHHAWAPTGDAIYYVAWDTVRGAMGLYHQPLSGGPPNDVLPLAEGRFPRALAPAADRLVTIGPLPGQRDLTIEILDFSGNVIARHVTDSDQRIALSTDGATLIWAATDVGAIVRVRPIAGGDPIDLTDGVSYNSPRAWTDDSRAVIATGRVDDVSAVHILPLDGGAPRVVKVPADEPRAQFSGAWATHATYRVQVGDDRNHNRIFALDLATGERALLTEGTDITRWRPGSDGFHFREQVGDHLHWRVAEPGQPTRTIYSAPADFAAERLYDFHGDRVVYTELVGDSVAVMIEDSPGAAPRVLATLGVPARRDACCRRLELSFSPDGQWIVANHPDSPSVATATLIRVPEEGRATEVRNVSLDAEWWYGPQWTPDSRGFTFVAGDGTEGWVAFAPTAPGQSVRHLSKVDGHAAWSHVISPDGRYVAYPAEVFRGSSLWRMDVP